MKLFKYILFIVILVGSLIFLVRLNELNITSEGNPSVIHVPYLSINNEYDSGFTVWVVLLSTLTIGVFIGFGIALFQIIANKSESISLRSKLKKLQVEIDSLRNQPLEDEIIIKDDEESFDV